MSLYAQLFARAEQRAKGASVREITRTASREPSVEAALAYEIVIARRILDDAKTSGSVSSFWNKTPIIKKCCENASRKCDEWGCTKLICDAHMINGLLDVKNTFCSYDCRDLYED